MAQYLDEQGLRTLVTKTKEYANKRVKDAVVTSASPDASKTITSWDDATSAAVYSPIQIAETQVTNLTTDLASKAPLINPAFSGTPTVPNVDTTLAGSQQIANTKYVKDLVGNIGEAMHYKGAVDSSHLLPTTDYKAGDTYKVAEAGTYAGKTCEVGDMIIANKNHGTGASNEDWDVIQTNIDGAVTGPGAATSGHFAIFDGDTGKVIKDAGYGLDYFKTKQNDYTVTSGALQTVNTITQNANGEIAVTFQDIQTASTTQKGVVQLQGSIGASESEDGKAATPKAVRDAINALDVTAVTVGASKTLTSISEEDGKISADAVDIEIAKSQVTGLVTDLTNIATSAENLNTKINEVSGAVASSAAALDEKITAVSGAVAGLDANVDSTGGVNVSANIVETDGKITSLTFVDKSVNATDITNAINALYVGPYVIPASGTITSISETDGKIAINSAAISITVDQVNDLSVITSGQISNLFPELGNK